MSDDRRNETQLVHDILGIESLVDEITYRLASEAKDAPTASAILGTAATQMVASTTN